MSKETDPENQYYNKYKYEIEVDVPVFEYQSDWDTWKRNEMDKSSDSFELGNNGLGQKYVNDSLVNLRERKKEEEARKIWAEKRKLLVEKANILSFEQDNNGLEQKYVRDSIINLKERKNEEEAQKIWAKKRKLLVEKANILSFEQDNNDSGQKYVRDGLIILKEAKKEEEAQKVWAKKRKLLVEKADLLDDETKSSTIHDEFISEAENTGNRFDRNEKHYLRWLRKKGKQEDCHPKYLIELEKVEKEVSKKYLMKRKWSDLVDGVQNYYRKNNGEQSEISESKKRIADRKRRKMISKIP